MIDSRPNAPASLITNHVKIKSDNAVISTASNSIYLVHPVCLVLTQYAHKIGNKLSYNIYIINNIESDICNVRLRDILPKGVRFISTFVDKGQYKYCKDKLLYEISIIKSHSFCKITLNVCPITFGKKINVIAVIGKKAKCTIHNPSKSCVFISLNKNKKIIYTF